MKDELKQAIEAKVNAEAEHKKAILQLNKEGAEKMTAREEDSTKKLQALNEDWNKKLTAV